MKKKLNWFLLFMKNYSNKKLITYKLLNVNIKLLKKKKKKEFKKIVLSRIYPQQSPCSFHNGIYYPIVNKLQRVSRVKNYAWTSYYAVFRYT